MLYVSEPALPYESQPGPESLIAKYEQLSDQIEETEAALDFFRLRRSIWDDWASIIAVARRRELIHHLKGMEARLNIDGSLSEENLLNVGGADSSTTLLDGHARLPESFAELQASLGDWIERRDELESLRNQLEADSKVDSEAEPVEPTTPPSQVEATHPAMLE